MLVPISLLPQKHCILIILPPYRELIIHILCSVIARRFRCKPSHALIEWLGSSSRLVSVNDVLLIANG